MGEINTELLSDVRMFCGRRQVYPSPQSFLFLALVLDDIAVFMIVSRCVERAESHGSLPVNANESSAARNYCVLIDVIVCVENEEYPKSEGKI